MIFDLGTVPRKLAVAGAAMLVTVAYGLPVWSHLRVDQLMRIGTRENLERAIQMQPENADLHNRLGRLLLYVPLGDAQRAREELERATQLDPKSGLYWVDVALARELEADPAGTRAALREARRREPRTPAVLWHEANFLVRQGEVPEALGVLKTLLQEAPEYTARALAFFSRVGEPGRLIAEAVPQRVDALDAALEYVRRENHVAAAAPLWAKVRGLEQTPSVFQLRLFVDWLIHARQMELARAAWNESGRRGWLPVDVDASLEGFYNSDFQKPIQGFGFDWRVAHHPDASMWIETRGPEAGMLSLCVQFGEQARGEYAHLSHWIPVEPRTHYALHASLRSEKLASRGGAFLQVMDLDGGRVTSRTDSVTGTSSWREVMTRIESGPTSRLLQVTLMRPAAASADETGTGFVCMADLRWQKLGPVDAGTGTPIR